MNETLAFDFERTFDQCKTLLGDLTFPTVAAWKQEHPGGRVIGYFPVYAPSEIIHAGGMLPVALHGAGDGLELQHADARFGSFICSIVKSTLELAMTDRLALMDGLLFSTICDSARNLAFVIKRNQPGKYVDFLHLPHNPNGTASHDFLAPPGPALPACPPACLERPSAGPRRTSPPSDPRPETARCCHSAWESERTVERCRAGSCPK